MQQISVKVDLADEVHPSPNSVLRPGPPLGAQQRDAWASMAGWHEVFLLEHHHPESRHSR